MSVKTVETFQHMLPAHLILSSENDLRLYGKDWLSDFDARPSLVLLPETISQVQEILRVCTRERFAVVPSGGRTGLSGGATATHGEIVLSLERMRKIHEVNETERTLRCEAGVTTERVQQKAEEHNLYFPVDFASKGSSQIGGNIATNAGGIRVIRYGCMRSWVLGLTVVDARGELLNLNGPLVKNQTGYDLRSLFIGSEGTLGVIVEAILKLTSRPGPLTRILCGVARSDAILDLLKQVQDDFLGLSAFEFFQKSGLEKVVKTHNLRKPFSEHYENYVLIDLELPAEKDCSARFLEYLEKGLIDDVIVAQSTQQAAELLAYRERLSETLSSLHVLHKNDISVPTSSIPAFVRELERLLAERKAGFEAVVFGHIGDGNLHVNLLKPLALSKEDFYSVCKGLDKELFALVQSFHGSISAEHGVGLLKKEFLGFSRSPAEIDFMRGIKRVFDPQGILNPGKIFDPDPLLNS